MLIFLHTVLKMVKFYLKENKVINQKNKIKIQIEKKEDYE